MDWIYRNIPGVEVLRRTHQILVVPKIPGTRRPICYAAATRCPGLTCVCPYRTARVRQGALAPRSRTCCWVPGQ
eukprot:844029-Rhodomonas_salina.1